ncbi:MAG: alpha/beta hydrolase [Boseongicola sp.]|nr:alpha/beta hydrolase [Boseongicola sp.]
MTPAVFVHGFLGGSRQWQGQIGALQGNDVVAVDLPGFGENADLAPLASIDGYASWVLGELTSRGVSEFHLIGHSMGGMIVQNMTLLAPDRVKCLVLYGTGATGVLPGRFETIETSKCRARSEGARATARRIAATWFLEGTEAAAYADCAAIAEEANLDAILTGLDAMQYWDGTAGLSDIGAKTLLIWGDQDRTYPWGQTEQLWRAINHASLAVIPNCAHAAHLEKPEVVNLMLKDFLFPNRLRA